MYFCRLCAISNLLGYILETSVPICVKMMTSGTPERR